jgi:hypothetical protein
MRKYDSTSAFALLIATLITIAVVALLAVIVMWLWNWIAVGLFGLPVVGFWEAFGIWLLSGILFKGCARVKTKRG